MIDCPLNRTKVKRGSQLPWAKLDESDVANIRQIVSDREALKRAAAELSNAKIADKFGVHRNTIARIISGEAWTHVE